MFRKTTLALTALGTGLLLNFAATGQTVVSVLRPGPGSNHDAMVVDAFPNNNYGWHEDATVSKWTAGGNQTTKRFFIKFDYASIPVQSVDSAKLYWYCNTISTSHGGIHSGVNDFSVSRITTAWNASTVTFANQPATTTVNAVNVPPSTSNTQDYIIDVTALVNDQLSSGINYGFGMKLNNETIYRSVVCSSGDHPDPNKRPKLVIYYSCTVGSPQFSTSIVAPLQMSFSSASGLPAGTTHVWDFGDGYMSTLANPTHQYAAQATYVVCHTVTDSCGSSTDCDTVDFCTPPSATFQHQANGLTVQFTSPTQNALSYAWDFGDGYSASLANPVHTYLNSGAYTACLTLTDTCGMDTACVNLELNGIGLSDAEAPRVFAQPNPTSGWVELVGILKPEKVELLGSNGQVLRSWNDGRVQFDLTPLAQGWYFLRVTTPDQTHHLRVVHAD